jgi:hypothetical protein
MPRNGPRWSELNRYDETDPAEADLETTIQNQIEKIPIRQGTEAMLKIKPQISFSDLHFTKRESDLMAALAAEYGDSTSDDMIETAHLENKPWDRIYNQEGKKQQHIPYELAIRPDEVDEIKRVANDREELLGRLR